jgi:hypothetical protein
MKRRSVLFAVVALVAVSSFGSAAHATLVSSDSGSVGSFTLLNTGISGGVSHLELTFTSPASEALQTINGGSVSGIGALFTTPVSLDVTPNGANTYTVTSIGTTAKVFTDAASGTSAELEWNLSSASTTVNPNVLNLAGNVTSVTTNGLVNAGTTYDFSPFTNGSGSNKITLTATSFSGGISSMASLIATAGGTATATGNGSFSETAANAIPEPASLALMGIGVIGLFTLRRLFKRTRAT